MIIGDPIPLDRVAGSNRNRAGHEVGTTLSDIHNRRRRAGEMGKKDDRQGQQAAMHLAWNWYFHNGAISLFAPGDRHCLQIAPQEIVLHSDLRRGLASRCFSGERVQPQFSQHSL